MAILSEVLSLSLSIQIFFWVGVFTSMLCVTGVAIRIVYAFTNYVFEAWIDLRDFARVLRYADEQGVNLFKRK